MLKILGVIILCFVGGLLYRIRGGGGNEYVRKKLHKPDDWTIENNYIRLPWAVLIACIAWYHLNHPQPSLLIFAAALMGITFGYFGGEFDLSRKENLTPRNFAILTLRGMLIMLPVGLITLPYNYPNPWYGVVAGALFVPCYLTGNILYKYWKLMRWTQWGEFLLGCVIIAGLI